MENKQQTLLEMVENLKQSDFWTDSEFGDAVEELAAAENKLIGEFGKQFDSQDEQIEETKRAYNIDIAETDRSINSNLWSVITGQTRCDLWTFLYVAVSEGYSNEFINLLPDIDRVLDGEYDDDDTEKLIDVLNAAISQATKIYKHWQETGVVCRQK